MKIKKRFPHILLTVLVILILTKISSALGISPAVVNYNFEPSLRGVIEYTAFEDNPDKELELYVLGDLAEYVKLDKTKLVGGGKFTATIKLPESIETPGKHKIIVGVKEKIDEELAKGTIGTSVIIQAVIVVYIPYPGEYLEIGFRAHDVNIGEPINFELDLTSRGKEDVIAKSKIEIVFQNKTMEVLYLKDREIKSQQAVNLKKTFDTTNYNPGEYNAIAIVDYGKIARAESKFKIGELIIYIVNHTKQIVIGNVKSFDIEIESGWNDQIDGAYAEVFILNESKPLINFKTTSTELTPWERKTITGFFDTSNFAEGFYDANITIFYYGREMGKSSNELVKVQFVEEKEINYILLSLVAIGIILLLVAIVLLIRKYLFKKKRKNEK
ncbi:MAG: hypothetical protein KJ721_00015 [Nanoarchaeota archaeon]|nr:hypothetical protein [Nanoarchaeota archaeon]